MSSLTLQRAKQRYLPKHYVPWTGRRRRVGTIGVWIAGIGVALLVIWVGNLLAMYSR